MQLLIIGGDARNRHLAVLARAKGHDVQLVGHDETPLLEATISRHVIMPFPISEKDGFAPAPLSAERLEITKACALIAPGAIVFATKPGPILSEYILKKGCTRIDLLHSEAFTVRNAVPSAEGGIHALMCRATICISGSHCLIVGYGRIGRALALRLRGLGAHVTVVARSHAARANAESDGCAAAPMPFLNTRHGCRFLINTVPFQIIGEEALAALPPGALALDLAGEPYGFDLNTATAMGITAWREPGLPGRYAPETAAAAMLARIEELDGA